MARILIIDAPSYLGEFLSEDLFDDGHGVIWMEQPDELTGILRSARPEIVLLDPYAYGFPGWKLLAAIKREAPWIPVLIMSAYSALMDDPGLAQADGYVMKDIETVHIRKKIHELLIEHPQEHAI
jgi:DNA-binding NtrC family response regulator